MQNYSPPHLAIFLGGHEIEHNNAELQCLHASKPTQKLAKPRSTSWSCGVSPSAPVAPGSSNKNAPERPRGSTRQQGTPPQTPRCSALRSLHSPLAFARASKLKNVRVSGPMTTSLARGPQRQQDTVRIPHLMTSLWCVRTSEETLFRGDRTDIVKMRLWDPDFAWRHFWTVSQE